jgi:6-phosphogluconolactonase
MPLLAKQIRVFKDAAALAEAAARHFVESIPDRGPLHVALSGGRIAKAFYDSIVSEVSVEQRNVDRIHFFFADERCVPASDPESNFLTARQSLFEPLQIRAKQTHRILGEVDDAYAAKEAEAELCRIAPMNSAGQPILDLVILGMGEDGHTASLFPGEPETFLSDPVVYRAVTAVKPPPRRITLGYAPLAAARRLIVLASGGGKEAILRKLLAEVSRGNPTLPLAHVLSLNPNFLIFSDIVGSESFAKNL